jgi:hypothetical protein
VTTRWARRRSDSSPVVAVPTGPVPGGQTEAVTPSPSPGPAARGIIRLLNTADGRALCLAGEVDVAAVDSFLQRYGREPARIDRIDAGSVTALSAPALELVLDHLDAADRAGRSVAVHPSPPVERLLAGSRACPSAADDR